MGNLHRHNLRLERWKWRKTDRFKLYLFSFEQFLAQITQGDGEPESGKCPARFNIDFFGYILLVLADVRAGHS